jgi:thiosulfate/3-mercaptopyruvate sulfurtransferase
MSLLLFSCKQNVSEEVLSENSLTITSEKYYSDKYIIEAEELIHLYKNNNIKIIDFRKEKNYLEGHITGALNIWRTDIEDTSYPYGGMMATKKSLEKLFSNLGISNKDQLIVYDDRGSCDAMRFWWVLQNYDFEAVKILNGGIDAWKAIDGYISAEKTPTFKTIFTLPENPSYASPLRCTCSLLPGCSAAH